MKGKILILNLILLLNIPLIYAESDRIIAYPKDLSPIVHRIEQLPEIRTLIAEAQEQGEIRVSLLRKPAPFAAFWDGDQRQILIGYSRVPSQQDLICSLIFELHNAVAEKRFTTVRWQARTGQITRKQYILEMERIEFENARKTVQLLRTGVQRGFFPRGTDWNIPFTFEEHLRQQQMCGHCEWHGKIYDDLLRRRIARV